MDMFRRFPKCLFTRETNIHLSFLRNKATKGKYLITNSFPSFSFWNPQVPILQLSRDHEGSPCLPDEDKSVLRDGLAEEISREYL